MKDEAVNYKLIDLDNIELSSRTETLFSDCVLEQ